ncbi:uncharacterized protein LOC127390620 [Apus apus]|uniref:uncharacterized protein LOC127390620 n=1 Tax=Apus apus TaxID=8895 RepID=UPI0021F87B0A|nr:uncharacterized protein LOC127390620 [Apus apus]
MASALRGASHTGTGAVTVRQPEPSRCHHAVRLLQPPGVSPATSAAVPVSRLEAPQPHGAGPIQPRPCSHRSQPRAPLAASRGRAATAAPPPAGDTHGGGDTAVGTREMALGTQDTAEGHARRKGRRRPDPNPRPARAPTCSAVPGPGGAPSAYIAAAAPRCASRPISAASASGRPGGVQSALPPPPAPRALSNQRRPR